MYFKSWGTEKMLSENVKKWYTKLHGKRKVLAAECSQSKNKAKIDCIREAIEFVVGQKVKDDDIKMLNETSP